MNNKYINIRTLFYILIAIVVIVCSSVIIANHVFKKYSSNVFNGKICCIMITGKDDARIKYAHASLVNFQNQTYVNKQLIIINHHPSLRVLHPTSRYKDIYEFKVNKTPDMTLGDMRNIALQMVPLDGCWTTWDDDDYRSPDYLINLAQLKRYSDNSIVAITSRLEYNANNGSSWVGTNTNGFVLFLAPADKRISYLPKNSLEDIEILEDFKRHGYNIIAYKNDPKMYVRLVHTNNTSTFVVPERNYLVRGETYTERFTSIEEKQYIEHVLKNNKYIM